MSVDLDELLTAEDVGRVLGGASPRQVMSWRREFGWPHVRIGRKFLWTPEQVEQIKRTHSVTAGRAAAPNTGLTSRSAKSRGRGS